MDLYALLGIEEKAEDKGSKTGVKGDPERPGGPPSLGASLEAGTTVFPGSAGP